MAEEKLPSLCTESRETRCSFWELGYFSNGVENLVEAGAISSLINRIPQEPNHILVVLLQTLHVCCIVNPVQAFLSNGLENAAPLLRNECARVREKAETVIKDLTVEAKGRNRALDLSILPVLLDLCADEDDHVQAKALSALMMIANATPGRLMAIDGKAIEKILPLVKSNNSEIRLNSIKVLTALGETPPGRRELLDNFEKIVSLSNDKSQEIRRADKILNAVVTSKH